VLRTPAQVTQNVRPNGTFAANLGVFMETRRDLLRFAAAAVCVLPRGVNGLAGQTAFGDQIIKQHIEWVGESLKRMRTVTPGMTRADLRQVFATEGGLSTGLWRRYVYVGCPWFKVDVEFEPVGRPARDADGRVTLVESDRDIIKTISKPYIEFSITD